MINLNFKLYSVNKRVNQKKLFSGSETLRKVEQMLAYFALKKAKEKLKQGKKETLKHQT